MARVRFFAIRVNETREGREIVFPYGQEREWYRMSWEDVPERYKQLYVAYLKLSGIEIPDWLKPYDTGTIDLTSADVEIDLSKCTQVPESYPLGV